MNTAFTFVTQGAFSFISILAFRILLDCCANHISDLRGDLIVQIKASLTVERLVLALIGALCLAGMVLYFGTPPWRVIAYSAFYSWFVLRRR